MSKRKTERLLGLVVCLLSTRRYLTADQIRQAVPGYPEQDDLFKRMFERDKEDLRDLGVPLETGLNHPFDDDLGYRIRQQAYELPELRLEADEAAVLGLAASATSSAGADAPSRKLYEEWQCSSAHGSPPDSGRRASRVTGGGAVSGPAGSGGGRCPAARQDIRRWSSRHGTGGLFQPTARTHQ